MLGFGMESPLPPKRAAFPVEFRMDHPSMVPHMPIPAEMRMADYKYPTMVTPKKAEVTTPNKQQEKPKISDKPVKAEKPIKQEPVSLIFNKNTGIYIEKIMHTVV